MIRKKKILFTLFLSCLSVFIYGQSGLLNSKKKILTKGCIDNGDTIPLVNLPTVYIFQPYHFKSRRERIKYYRLVRDVKKTLPLAKIIRNTIIETYEYIETLPDSKAKRKHIRKVEKGIKKQYTKRMKKLTFRQGKLLIKLVDRECNQSSYQIVKAFMGPFKAGFYQTFASIFGASLKKKYEPDKKDRRIEEIILLVENNQL